MPPRDKVDVMCRSLQPSTVLRSSDRDHSRFCFLRFALACQVFGRAGRPQYDTSGEAIMITTHKSLDKCVLHE